MVSSRISITLLAAVYRRPMDPLKMDALILKQTKLGVDWHSIFHGKILFLGESVRSSARRSPKASDFFGSARVLGRCSSWQDGAAKSGSTV